MDTKERRRLLAEWRGGLVPLEVPGPVNLSEVFQREFRRIGLSERLREATLVDSWHEVAGATLAPHCRPGAVRRGVLTVRVDHPAWLHQIQLSHKQDILREVQTRFPQLKVKDLLLRIG